MYPPSFEAVEVAPEHDGWGPPVTTWGRACAAGAALPLDRLHRAPGLLRVHE